MGLELDPETGMGQAPPRRGLRTGFTTGACATAATTGACRALSGAAVTEVDVPLPAGFTATFALASLEMGERSARASVIKDAGDDPDVTHGAEVVATVELPETAGAPAGSEWTVVEPGVVRRQLAAGTAIELRAGDGVGTVTRPGLGLPVGGPAINPVPRRMLSRAVRESLTPLPPVVRVSIGIRDGERLARRTLNGRLGIVGGLSVLGTTGVVKPYSTASWRASVLQGVDVAAAASCREIVASTGGRSERYARDLLPHLPEVAFVEIGEFAGQLLRRARDRDLSVVWFSGMIGKVSKMAQGRWTIRASSRRIDLTYLARVAGRAGAPSELSRAVGTANSARHAQELVRQAGLPGFFELLAADLVAAGRRLVGERPEVRALVFDFDGDLLAADPPMKGRTTHG